MPLGAPQERRKVSPLMVVIVVGLLAWMVTAAILLPRLTSRYDYLSPQASELRQSALSHLRFTADADYTKAARQLQELAEKGDPFAWIHWAHIQAQYFDQDAESIRRQAPAGIIREVKSHANDGDPEAAYLMAMYLAWFDPDGNPARVRGYAKMSADGGYVPGMTIYAYDLVSGRYGDKDLQQARRYFEKAAKLGDIAAMNKLGAFLVDPENPDFDFEAGLAWFKRSADGGYKSAFYGVGWCYEKGIGTKLDQAEALKWYERGAELNEPMALFAVGYKYANGEAVKKDTAKAREYFERASAQGYDDATRWIEMIDSGEAP